MIELLQPATDHTLEEVGRIFKVTRERVRQIEAKAVRKLQNPVRSQHLEGFLQGTVPIESVKKEEEAATEIAEQPADDFLSPPADVGNDSTYSGFDPTGEIFQKDFQFEENANLMDPSFTDVIPSEFGG